LALTLAEREEISRGIAAHQSARRSASTVSRRRLRHQASTLCEGGVQLFRVAHFLRTARHPAEEDETFETLDLRVRQDMWGIGQVWPPA
jgi:hypothetical protein